MTDWVCFYRSCINKYFSFVYQLLADWVCFYRSCINKYFSFVYQLLGCNYYIGYSDHNLEDLVHNVICCVYAVGCCSRRL